MDDCIESDIVFKWTYLCRLCLTSNPSINIFESEETSKEIISNLQTELNLLAYAGDPMPQKLCISCSEQLISWKKFKEKSIESDIALKKRLVPFKSLDFVRTYLDKISDSGNQTKKDAESCGNVQEFPFPVLSVKQEPNMEDSPAKDTGIFSGCTSEVTDSGHNSHVNADNLSDRGRDDWSCDNNSADTVFDEPVPENINGSIGLEILRQMIGEVGKTSVDKEPVDTSKGVSEIESQQQNESNEVEVQSEAIMEATEDIPSDSLHSADTPSSCPTPMIGVVRIENLISTAAQAESSSNRAEEGNGTLVSELFKDVKVKEEAGLPVTNDPKKYNLRRRREANYGEEDDWPEEKRRAPAPQHKLTPWKCEVCNVYFSSLPNLTHHHSSASCLGTQMDSFSCLICLKKFFSEKSLAEHNLKHAKIVHNNDVDELRQCSKCDLAFADPWRLKQHKICHAQKSIPSRAIQYTCHDCGLVFIKLETFEEHKKSHAVQNSKFVPNNNPMGNYTSERAFGCSLCVARFGSEDFLYDHRFAVHGIADERVVCPTCSVKFRDGISLAEHMLSHASKATARKTTNPFFKISNLRTLGKEPQSLGGGSVRCRRCGMVFSSRQELLRHESLKHKNLLPYSCRKCNRRFPTRSNLLMHGRDHSGTSVNYQPIIEQPVGENEPEEPSNFIVGLTCLKCQIKFKSQLDVDEHAKGHKVFNGEIILRQDRHNAILKFQCRQCPRLFTFEASGQKHSMLKHNGSIFRFYTLQVPIRRSIHPLPSFSCLECNRNFKCQASLNFHNKIKHSATNNSVAVVDSPTSSNDVDDSMESQEEPCDADGGILANLLTTKALKCRHCPRIYKTEWSLKRHEKGHGNPSMCSTCPRIFDKNYSIKTIRLHEESCRNAFNSVSVTPPTPPQSTPPVEAALTSDSSIKCAVCGNTYETHNLLELHTMTAHGLVSMNPVVVREKELWQEEDNKIVREVGGVQKCTMCQIDLDNTNAGWHRSQHPRGNLYILQIGDSLFQCTVCDQLLSNRRESMLHAAAHGQPDIKPHLPAALAGTFNCPFCNARFASEDSIRSHIFAVHSGGS